jgi:hypothetical protein
MRTGVKKKTSNIQRSADNRYRNSGLNDHSRYNVLSKAHSHTHRNKFENLKAAFQYRTTEHIRNLRSRYRNSYNTNEVNAFSRAWGIMKTHGNDRFHISTQRSWQGILDAVKWVEITIELHKSNEKLLLATVFVALFKHKSFNINLTGSPHNFTSITEIQLLRLYSSDRKFNLSYRKQKYILCAIKGSGRVTTVTVRQHQILYKKSFSLFGCSSGREGTC